MLLAGIQAKSGLDPRLKHSGVTLQERVSLEPSPFSKERTKVTKNRLLDSKKEDFDMEFLYLRALRVLRGGIVPGKYHAG